MAKKVKATATGFYGGSRRRSGQVFVVPDTFRASWVVDLPREPEPEAPKRIGKGAEKSAPSVVDDLT